MDDSVAVTIDKIDSEHKEELQKFKKDVQGSRLIEYWKTPDDLTQKVSISLHKQMDRKNVLDGLEQIHLISKKAMHNY